MKLNHLFNGGACGIEQALFLGEISFNAPEVSSGLNLTNKLPKGFKVSRLVCDVKTAFNAATTNTITLGTSVDEDVFMTSDDITAGTVGADIKNVWLDVGEGDVEVYAKYAQTGTAATAGKAEFYAFLIKLPE